MPAPIIAAYDPYTEDRAPVELALAAAELTGAPRHRRRRLPVGALRRLHAIRTRDDATRDGRRRRAAPAARGPRRRHARSLTEALGPARRCTCSPASTDAGLIVVGSTGRGRAGRVLTGSTAERLLHGAPCPVALAPHGYERTRARDDRRRLRRLARRPRRRSPRRTRWPRASARGCA